MYGKMFLIKKKITFHVGSEKMIEDTLNMSKTISKKLNPYKSIYILILFFKHTIYHIGDFVKYRKQYFH